MFGRDRQNVWAYDMYATNVLSYQIFYNYFHGPLKVYFACTSHFLVSPRYYSTSGGFMRLSFFGNLNDYYHEFHGIENSFHFETILHSLQGMVRI